MSTGLYSHTTRGIGTVLTAAIYNADHNNHITNANPLQHGAYSDDVNQMRVQVDPGGLGSESLAGTLAGELARLRYVFSRIAGTTYWYEVPTLTFGTIQDDIDAIEADIVAIEADITAIETGYALKAARAYAEYTSYTAFTGVIPLDDTTPTSSEGNELLSAAITLNAAASKARIRFKCVGSATDGIAFIAAIFRGTTCIATKVISVAVNAASDLAMEIEDTPGSVGPHTYSVRIGRSAAGTFYINGSAGGRWFNGTSKATLVIEEVRV